MSDLCSFTHAHYAHILDSFLANGYRFMCFAEVALGHQQERTVVLRHDLDIDPLRALPMAEIEASRGIQAAYYVQLSSRFYNAAAMDNRKVVRRLLELGHEVGLHFDSTIYQTDDRPLTAEEMEALINEECRVLAGIAGPVGSVSFHRPTPRVFGLTLRNLLNTYDQRFFTKMKYISDSMMYWREGCACGFAASAVHPYMQVLTHPEWWSDSPGDIDVRIADMFGHQGRRYEEAMFTEIVIR